MNRRWIGIELFPKTVQLIKKRLIHIINRTVRTRVDKLTSWEGGGHFTIYKAKCEFPKHTKKSAKTKNSPFVQNLFRIDSDNDLLYQVDLESEEKLSKKLNHESFSLQQMSSNPDINLINSSNPIYILQNLSQIFLKYNLPLVQSAFYSPSHDFLDYVDNNKFISINNRICKNLKSILNRSGFLIIHATESTHANFRMILDNIFGQDHHVSTIIWTKVGDSVSPVVSLSHQKSPSSHFDYLIIYCKDPEKMAFNKLPPDPSTYSNPDKDPRGPWHSMPLVASQKSTNKIFSYTFKNGNKEWTLTKKWRYPFYSIQKLERENRLYFTNPKNGFGTPRVKKFLCERIKEYNKTGARGFTPNSLWIDPQKFTVSETYKRLIEMTTKQNDIIIDCFSMNREIKDENVKLNRKFIRIQRLEKEKKR